MFAPNAVVQIVHVVCHVRTLALLVWRWHVRRILHVCRVGAMTGTPPPCLMGLIDCGLFSTILAKVARSSSAHVVFLVGFIDATGEPGLVTSFGFKSKSAGCVCVEIDCVGWGRSCVCGGQVCRESR